MLPSHVYHYYFDLYDSKKPKNIRVRYEAITRSPYTHTPMLCTKAGHVFIIESDLGKVVAGRSVFLEERNDELARELITEYLESKVNKCQKDLDKAVANYNFVKDGIIHEDIEVTDV